MIQLETVLLALIDSIKIRKESVNQSIIIVGLIISKMEHALHAMMDFQ